MKKCSTCAQDKPEESFYADKKKADGLCTQCKDCRNATHKKHRDANKEVLYARRRGWGELNREALKEKSTKRRNEKRAMCLVAAARVRAKAKNIPFALTSEDILALQEVIDAGVCQLSGAAFTLVGPRSATSPSLDRIVPALGYTTGNVRIICHALNAALGDWGEAALSPVMVGWLERRNAINSAAAQAFIESVM